jgi:hypothetical protein
MVKNLLFLTLPIFLYTDSEFIIRLGDHQAENITF